MKPYYEQDGTTIYHGDCVDVLLYLQPDYVLITDPPYGVGLGIKKDKRKGKHGLRKSSYANDLDTYEVWREHVPARLDQCLSRAKRGCVFTGPHIKEQPKPDAIGGIFCPAGSGRHSWGFKTFLPVLFYGKAPRLNEGAKQPNTIHSNLRAESNGHPCPKPLAWMKWLITLATEPGDIVLDPFMGSGTTLRAAKDLGLKAIGIEIEEKYCEIAAKRLSQAVLQFAA